jgi:hypothetical protein
MKTAAAILFQAIVETSVVSPATRDTEDIECRDLNLTGWNCANQLNGMAKTQGGTERNRMKNRCPSTDLSANQN